MDSNAGPGNNKLKNTIEDVKSTILSLINEIKPEHVESIPHVKRLAKALNEMWGVFNDLISASDRLSEDSALAFYINNILPRYTLGIGMASLLCRAEMIDALARVAFEYLEKALVLDFHPDHKDWPLDRKVRWLLGDTADAYEERLIKEFIEDKEYLEKFKEIIREMIPDKELLKRVIEDLRDFYGSLSGSLHGTTFRELFLENPEEAVVPLPCSKAKQEAELISGVIEWFTQYLKITLRIISLTTQS